MPSPSRGFYGPAKADTPIAAKLQSWVDDCRHCGKAIGWDRSVQLVCGDLLHADCEADYEVNRSERAYEDFCSDYYGGSGPVTQREHDEAAWAEKRAMQ